MRLGATRRSRARRRGAASALAVLVVSLLGAAPAVALPEQGHEFGATVTPSGESALLEPGGVAVGEAAGDVYVSDRGHDRVEVFTTSGTFVAAWGWGVKGGTAYAVCKAGEGCGAGAKAGAEAFKSPEWIAVDNSSDPADPSKGDVYVANAKGRPTIDKFSADGAFLGTVLGKTESKELGEEYAIDGIAVDPHGALWAEFGLAEGREVGNESKILHFSDAVQNEELDQPEIEYSPSSPLIVRPGFAVNGGDPARFYIDVEPYGSETARHPCQTVACTIVGLYEEGEENYLAELGEAFAEGMLGASATGIAADLVTNALYVVHPGSISAYDGHQRFVQSFGEGRLTRAGGAGVDSATDEVFVTDAATGSLEVYVPRGTASSPGSSAPSVDRLRAQAIATTSATAAAQIDPNGESTSITFEYGSGSCASGECRRVAAEAAPAGYGDVERSVALTDLAPGATYALRVTAQSSAGTSTRETAFTTRPLPLADGRAWELVSSPDADGAGYEALPHEGGLIEAAEDGSALTYLSSAPTEADAQGNRALAYSQNLAQRRTNPSTDAPEWSSEDIEIPGVERTPGVDDTFLPEYEYFSPDLTDALIQPYGSYPKAEPALTAPAEPGEEQEKTLYLRHNEGRCYPLPSTCYEALVTAADDHGVLGGERTHFGGLNSPDTGLKFSGASPDAQHVVFASEVPLVESPQGGDLYEWNASEPESLKAVGLLPALTPGEDRVAAAAELGGGELVIRDAVNSDGRQVIFNFNKHLYIRDTAREETIRLDLLPGESPSAEEATPLGGGGEVQYEGASEDGRRVFFLDSEPLVAGSAAIPSHRDLFEWEQTSQPGEPLRGELRDVTTPVRPGERATVKGLVPAISQDGTVAYLVADGVLATNTNAEGEQATPGKCAGGQAEAATTCNLYVEKLVAGTWHATFIARLAGADLPDFGTAANYLQDTTAGDSPSGQYFAFMSKRSLIRDYDNQVTNPEADGARAEEVYLFDAASGSLACVSCESDGARPVGVNDIEESGEGIGLLVDRGRSWISAEAGNVWLAGSIPGWTSPVEKARSAYRPRYIDNEGRLFFNSPEPLVPADENGKNDVYEYEPDGLGSCATPSGCVSLVSSGTSPHESAFLDASASGGDVFFLTEASLVPEDLNGAYDVYDAHECTSASPCVQPKPPLAEECNSRTSCDGTPPTTAPALTTAPTTATGPSGNLPTPAAGVLSETTTKPKPKPTRAQLLAKALKACKKHPRGPKRRACERAAHKKYGPKVRRKK